MLKRPQLTIKQTLTFEGIGVHTGQKSSITLKPAIAGTGIIVRHVKFPDSPLHIGRVVPEEAMYATVLANGQWQVSTIEHVMAAIGGLGIDNVIIEVDSPEVPILDGSAHPFAQKILETGLEELSEDAEFLTPKKTLIFEDKEDNRRIEIQPAQMDGSVIDTNLYVDYSADFDHHLVGAGNVKGQIGPTFFVEEIAPARTFGFLSQLPQMRKEGLAQGASLDNTVVIGEDGYLNERRFDDEFVRHKLLDLIGDLTLLGKKLAGTLKARRTGHRFNRQVIEHYIQHPDQWDCI